MHNRFKKRSSANAKNSSKLHTVRNSISFHPTPLAKKIIFVVIVLVFVSVSTALFLSYYLTDERLVKSRIDDLASDYYENFFYENSILNIPTEKLSTTLEKYTTSGFSLVTLRQLLLYDDEKNAKYTDYLLTHCDENSTYVKFYPFSPYDRTSYRTEFTYSCDF